MADAQFIYGVSFDTTHGPCVAGEPVHPKWNNPRSREFICKKYGKNAVIEVDPEHPESVLDAFADSEGDITKRFVQLKQLVVEQAKVIRKKDHEIERMKKHIQRLQAN